MGLPQKSSIRRLGFFLINPCSCGGTPIYGHPHTAETSQRDHQDMVFATHSHNLLFFGGYFGVNRETMRNLFTVKNPSQNHHFLIVNQAGGERGGEILLASKELCSLNSKFWHTLCVSGALSISLIYFISQCACKSNLFKKQPLRGHRSATSSWVEHQLYNTAGLFPTHSHDTDKYYTPEFISQQFISQQGGEVRMISFTKHHWQWRRGKVYIIYLHVSILLVMWCWICPRNIVSYTVQCMYIVTYMYIHMCKNVEIW